MKKIYLLIVLVALFACENNSSTDVTKQENESIIAHLAANNFKVNHVTFEDEKVVLDGDGYFNRADLLSDIKNFSRNKQYRTTYLVSASKVTNMKLKFATGTSTKPSTTWKSHMTSAMANWTNISGSSLAISETTGSTYDIYCKMGNLTYGAIAQAEFPTSTGNPGSTITISKTNYGLSTAQMIFTVTHEMGHCFGFRHTNYFDRNSDGNATTNDNEGASTVGAIHIPGTPTGLDANSVMNAIVQSWVGFGAYDIVATQYMYP